MGTRAKKKSKTKLIVVLLVFAVILALILAAALYVNNVLSDMNGENRTEETVTVSVVSGDTTAVIAKKLEQAGIIRYPTVFRIVAGMQNADTNLHIGTYEFAKGESYDAILHALKQAPNYRPSVRITFTEGMEVSDVIAKFLSVAAAEGAAWTAGGFEAALTADYGYDYIPAANVANRLEGFLYPDTYDFFLDSTETELLSKMISQFNKKAAAAGLQEKAAAVDMTLYEALTLGSIIQKEAGKTADFNMVSSVFHNRLRDDWLLQSDAAVSYPIPKAERLPSCTYEQLQTDTPYNVYMHKGLTPTPICNPSIDAAIAACEPSVSEYFYFIGYIDGTTGEQITVFAKTYKEHQSNINKYLK